MFSRYQTALLIFLALTLSGCGIFGSKDEEAEPPAELVDFDETLKVKRRWSTKVGGDASELRIGLSPAADGVRVYAAGVEGRVQALSPEKGNRLWTQDIDLTLTAGPAVGDNRVVVASNDGDIVALDAATGNELWRTRIAAEVLATPAVGGERVVVRTGDGRLIGLHGESGEEVWVIEEEVPPLSLRGTSAPVITADLIVCGFDNGRLMAVQLLTGEVAWEQIITAPTGRSDLERLVDIDGAVATVGQDVYATGFQGQVVAIALESGQLLWGREISSYQAAGLDWTQTYVSNAKGALVSLSRSSGVEQWRNNVLENRELSAPVAFGDAVVVGDFEGYLHFFSASAGELLARTRAGKGRISGSMHAEGDLLLVQTESGELSAYEIASER